MLPVILVSDDKKKAEEFIYAKKNSPANIIIRIAPEKTEFSVEQIREIIKSVKISQPYNRFYVLEDFDRSSTEAQNAFLKTLEEAPATVGFILLVSNLHLLLPTVISRAMVVSLKKTRKLVIDGKITQLLDCFIKTKDFKALLDETFIVSSKAEAMEKIDQILFFFRKRLADDKKSFSIIRKALEIRDLLVNNNLNSQLAVDNILLALKSKYS